MSPYKKSPFSKPFDLITTDGRIEFIKRLTPREWEAEIAFYDIPETFIGFDFTKDELMFNLKSSICQVGATSELIEVEFSRKHKTARARIKLTALLPLGKKLLSMLGFGCYIGKLFAFCNERKVRDPDYLYRLFNKSDRYGKPLLCFGSSHANNRPEIEKIDGFTVAFLPVIEGVWESSATMEPFLPTLVAALKSRISVRHLLSLHQKQNIEKEACASGGEMICIKTSPWHMYTTFGLVADHLLPSGVKHTSASLLQPDSSETAEIYEFFGESSEVIERIPLEFYTLEYYRESVYFSERNLLTTLSNNHDAILNAFLTCEPDEDEKVATFIVKGEQLLHLNEEDWIRNQSPDIPLPTPPYTASDIETIEAYVKKQPITEIVEAIESDLITSEGIILTNTFPSSLMKSLLVTERVRSCVKAIYFQSASKKYHDYFSHQDRSLMMDFTRNGIDIIWVDRIQNKLLKFCARKERDSGFFVPLELISQYNNALFIGLYGSTRVAGTFTKELEIILDEMPYLAKQVEHPLLNANKTIALVTGGGPGAMQVANIAAKERGILSCGQLVDFSQSQFSEIAFQEPNPHLDCKMTYRLDRLVERQAEFYLDLPILVTGGTGTDFEQALEEVRRQTGSFEYLTPVILFHSEGYWEKKISSRYQLNVETGTLHGSEWISNCFFVASTAEEVLSIWSAFFKEQLKIGPEYPGPKRGFESAKELISKGVIKRYSRSPKQA